MKARSFEKGNFSLILNEVGGIHIEYRRFTFEIGFFVTDNYSLFSFKFFNFMKEINLFQIFEFHIFSFFININIDIEKY